MRNDVKRKISITAASCLAIACVSVGGITLASANQAVDPVLSMENQGKFYMVEGASVKLWEGETADGIDGNAMRFVFELSEDQYNAMVTEGAYNTDVSVSAYVIAEDKIDEGLTTAEEIMTDADVNVAPIPVEKWRPSTSKVKDSTANVYYACAYVYNLPIAAYDKTVSSFAVVNVNGTKLYTSVQSRSMAYVADAALDSGKYESDRTILEGYLPTYGVSFYNGEELLETKQVKYGNAVVAPELDLVGNGTADAPEYALLGWYAKQANGEWGTELITSLPDAVGAVSYKAAIVDTKKASWLAVNNADKLVTDFTTGPYQKQTEDYSSFRRAHSDWQFDAAKIVTNESVGGVTDTYAKVTIDSSQGSVWSSALNFSLINTMPTDTLKKYAALGYTLKLPVYLNTNGNNSGKTSDVYTLEYDYTGETPTLKTITGSTRKTTISTDTWEEVEIDINDYILMMESLQTKADSSGNRYYYAVVTNDSAVLNIKVYYGTSEISPWDVYFGGMYLAPDIETLANVKVVNGYKLDLSTYVTVEGDETYEYYTLANGTLTEIASDKFTVQGATEIVIVKVLNDERTFVGKINVTVETADAWLATMNTDKTVTDFEDANSAYQKLMTGKTYTYFANSTYPTTYAYTTTSSKVAGTIVTDTIGGVEGTYATLKVDNASFRPIWLQPTMKTAEMQKYYELGYTLKLKVYVNMNATIRGLHYDRTDPANIAKSSATGTTYADESDEYAVTKNTWTEITLNFEDYIYDCVQNNTDAGPISTQIKHNDSKLRGTIWLDGVSYGPTIYMTEMYLEAPKGEETVTANENDVLTVTDYKPTEDAVYEYYKLEDGVYTAIQGTELTVGTKNFQIAVVKVSIADGNVERTFVNRVEVTVQTEATA